MKGYIITTSSLLRQEIFELLNTDNCVWINRNSITLQKSFKDVCKILPKKKTKASGYHGGKKDLILCLLKQKPSCRNIVNILNATTTVANVSNESLIKQRFLKI